MKKELEGSFAYLPTASADVGGSFSRAQDYTLSTKY